ncbi:MAG: methyltransferase domain-containing protein [Candidatus Omnitrophica bacterium]|nr:methyltransferase domain-containing protein [Candidatus Omnitrophota bacterium]
MTQKNPDVGAAFDAQYDSLVIDDKNPNIFKSWAENHKGIINEYLAKIDRNGAFLEAGCGTGFWCFYARSHYDIQRVIGVDVAQNIIKKLSRFNSDKITFMLDDLNNSKLPDNSFDMLISLGVVEHFKESRPMLKTLQRIIKPNGYAIISVPNWLCVHPLTRVILKLTGNWNLGYEKSISPRGLARLVRSVGFTVIEYGILPSGEMFGSFLNSLPFIGRCFKVLSYFIERRNRHFGFISYAVCSK